MRIQVRKGVTSIFKQSFPVCVYCFLMACIVFGFFCAGCSGDRKSDVTDFQLNLNNPEVDEREVSVNGGVAAPVDRIQWDWGDGQIDSHRFFPANHTYKDPGQYNITVTVFNNKGETATKSVTVVINVSEFL